MSIAEIILGFAIILCSFLIGWSKKKRYAIPAALIYIAVFAVMILNEITKG